MIPARPLRAAVVFKTYAWDPFVHRQAERLAATSAGAADFFVAIDETNGSVGAVPFDRVIRTTNTGLVASGLANRFEEGSLLWWNPDYVHYDFRTRFPDYDVYIFAEYDVIVQGGLAGLLETAAATQADLITLPIREPKSEWFWTLFHQQTYRLSEIRGGLNCIALYSARALDMLAARRRAMDADPTLRYWPSAEVFVSTEIARAGYIDISLADCGDVSRYHAFPPIMEDDLPQPSGAAFLHPVLDSARTISSWLKSTPRTSSFWERDSDLRRALARFPEADYRNRLLPAAKYRAKQNIRNRIRRTKLRLMPGALLPE